MPSRLPRPRRVGNGLESGVQMGPVITPDSKTRIETLIGKGESTARSPSSTAATRKFRTTKRGNFLKPTVLDGVPVTSELAHTEIFGPVLSLVHASYDR